MNSVFDWRNAPSDIVKGTGTYRKPNLAPKRYQTYQSAKPSDESREAEISQVNSEIEIHFHLAQTVNDDVMRGYHRDEARKLAARVRTLVQGRSAAFVAQLEAERGIA